MKSEQVRTEFERAGVMFSKMHDALIADSKDVRIKIQANQQNEVVHVLLGLGMDSIESNLSLFGAMQCACDIPTNENISFADECIAAWKQQPHSERPIDGGVLSYTVFESWATVIWKSNRLLISDDV